MIFIWMSTLEPRVYKNWILEFSFPNREFLCEFFFPKFALFYSEKMGKKLISAKKGRKTQFLGKIYWFEGILTVIIWNFW